MNKYGVLVINDSPIVTEALILIIENDPMFYIVDVARNGFEGVMKTLKYKPDLITLDLEFSIEDGFQTIKVIMEKQPTPIIILNEHICSDAKLTMKALELGAVDYIGRNLFLKTNDTESNQLFLYKLRDIAKKAPDLLKHIHRYKLEQDMHYAIEKSQLEVLYQPQVNLRTGKLFGMEALLRWNHPKHGVLSPSDFIPVLEDGGIMEDIGEWVLYTACSQMKEWNKELSEHIKISVNISSFQLINAYYFLHTINRVLKDSNINSRNLCLELTETSALQNLGETNDILNQLKDKGIDIAIDDFGTGYSTLAYLKKLEVNIVKIDRAFIKDLPDDPYGTAIINALVEMGQSLGFRLIAEGAETKEQLILLNELGCEIVQGYYFSKPLPADKINKNINNIYNRASMLKLHQDLHIN